MGLDGLMSETKRYNESMASLFRSCADMGGDCFEKRIYSVGKRIDYERTGRAILDEF